jgi:hypothetical protein
MTIMRSPLRVHIIIASILVLAVLSCVLLRASAAVEIPTPQQFLGFRVGDDKKLARWDRIVEYMRVIANASDRVRLRELGKTTNNNPFLLLEISSADTIRNLDHLKQLERKLYFQGGAPTDAERDEIVVLASNIDNMTGEALGWLMERLLTEGALDVSYAPIQMKKNRPGVQLTVLASSDDAERLSSLILRESATLGVRMSRMERRKAGRREETIETPLGEVRVKLKLLGERVVAATPEYEDCRALAERHGLPLENVVERVTQAARIHFGLETLAHTSTEELKNG